MLTFELSIYSMIENKNTKVQKLSHFAEVFKINLSTDLSSFDWMKRFSFGINKYLPQ